MRVRSFAVLAVACGVPVVVAVSCKEKTAITAAPVESASVTATASATATATATASATAAAAASGAASAAADDAVDCEGLLAAATSRVDLARMKHGHCKGDGDCVMVKGGACVAACEEAMAASGVGEYEEARKRTKPLCDTYFRADCAKKHPTAATTCITLKSRCMACASMSSSM